MQKAKYHLPEPRALTSDAFLSVMQRNEDGLNLAIDGIRELWGLSPRELLTIRRLPLSFAEDIRYYAHACLCFEYFISSLENHKDGIHIPSAELSQAIKRDIGSFEELCYQIKTKGKEYRGVGFIWLICERGKIKLVITPNYELPNGSVLICFSLWENAYLERYGDNRERYLNDCIYMTNWENAHKSYGRCING